MILNAVISFLHTAIIPIDFATFGFCNTKLSLAMTMPPTVNYIFRVGELLPALNYMSFKVGGVGTIWEHPLLFAGVPE